MPDSPKVQVVLAPYVHAQLLHRAEEEGRSISSLAAFLLELQLRSDTVAPRAKSASA